MADGIVSCKQFASFLDTQSPYYDKYIISDIRPNVSLIGMVKTATWEAFTEAQHFFDRFRHVQPNVAKPWTVKGATQNYPNGCGDNPCDKKANRIGWGYSRLSYGLQEISWMTDLICYDQSMHFTQAVAHFEQIISDILRPATTTIQSHKIRKEMSALDGSKKWVASLDMHDFTFHWEQNANGDEIYMVMDSGGPPTSKLTPQMLQSRVHTLMLAGYMDKRPFEDSPPLIELLTHMETVWDLDKQASANPTAFTGLQGQYRYMDWAAANQYWKYAFSGQLGNFVIRADPTPFRFNKISNTRFQLVLPYVNSSSPDFGIGTTVGIGSNPNPDYQKCIYGFSIIWHREAMVAETLEPASINPRMPFASRNFGGEWKWAMNNLGTDKNGCVIENIRGNKGLFYGDFVQAFKPERPEWAETIFHQLAPPCVQVVVTCQADPGYPEQYYSSENDSCDVADECLVLTPAAASNGHYKIAANTVRVNGVPIVHTAIDQTTIAGLVTALGSTNYTNSIGTWDTVTDSTTDIQVCGVGALSSIDIPWLAT
jgi:hypothetical protein